MMTFKALEHKLIGVGRLFDFSSSYSRAFYDKYLATPSRTLDRDALASDWVKIGGDMRSAIERFRKSRAF
jgi:hypothetical protein